jgi:hypothetical protein
MTAKIKQDELSALEKVKSEDPGAPFHGHEDSTARIQSSLQSVVSQLDCRGTTPGSRESIRTLSAVARSALGRHSGVLHSEELSITRT